eukprot:m.365677 g.365677  ORF g.365677 m.365677 type:complete len:61 (-) comp56058_c1_seq10:136-318(-)
MWTRLCAWSRPSSTPTSTAMHRDFAFSVCPAGWQPGRATIKPDPEGKLYYFQKINAKSDL